MTATHGGTHDAEGLRDRLLLHARRSVQKPNVLAPNYGMRVAPMAYSPQTGYFYATGAAGLTGCGAPTIRTSSATRSTHACPASTPSNYGVLAAIDSRTNKIAWKKEYRPGRPSGAMTTAGGLCSRRPATATSKRSTRKPATGCGSSRPARPAVRRRHTTIDGEQYIATIAGANVWAFKLGGTLPPAAAPVSPSRRRSPARSPTPARSRPRRSRATTASSASAISPTNTRSRRIGRG